MDLKKLLSLWEHDFEVQAQRKRLIFDRRSVGILFAEFLQLCLCGGYALIAKSGRFHNQLQEHSLLNGVLPRRFSKIEGRTPRSPLICLGFHRLAAIPIQRPKANKIEISRLDLASYDWSERASHSPLRRLGTWTKSSLPTRLTCIHRNPSIRPR